ncbi:hypothetical protein BB559_001360 [Furculomyces boomerangus]|uniref:AMP-dependent synthetase/ligase domain-containing protein n=1 Tax=Furculomyces boomerangus TaxID=61424 RepID=A0A2T9Z260_9FUNG|nr:hypothetical protein BB559_001360 [Furculomyces boomerangus]
MIFDKKILKSYIVPNSETKGSSPILRNPEDIETLEFKELSDLRTIYDVFWKSVREAPNNDFLGYRPFNEETRKFMPYQFISYKDASIIAENFGAGVVQVKLDRLKRSGATEKEIEETQARNWPVGIYSANRPEWQIIDKGLCTQSLYSVALYDTLGKTAYEYIVNHSSTTMIVCTLDKIPKILLSSSRIPNVKTIICIDPFTESNYVTNNDPTLTIPSPFNIKSVNILKSWAKQLDIDLYDFNEIQEIGKQSRIPHFPPKPENIYTLLYTSGTTGNPKGVISTHENYASAAVSTYLSRGFQMDNDDIFLSYLPLPHAYGRTTENYMIVMKGKIGYYSGNVGRIVEDLHALQPTYFAGVPRLLNRFYDVLTAKTINLPGKEGEICRKAVQEKISNLHKGLGVNHKKWDELIFNKTKAMISPKLRQINTGSAPLEPRVCDFLIVSLICKITEGYAMSETSSTGIMQQGVYISNGDTGIPFHGVEVKLIDIPEMNYLVTDLPLARGEVCMRGKNIFGGYLKDPEKTKEALIGDGWIASGDVAQINLDGTISIIDRKKSIFKMAQGVYISPEKIENVLIKHPLILQAFVTGQSVKEYLVGVIVPDPETFIPWAKKLIQSQTHTNTESYSFETLVKNNLVKNTLLADIESICRETGLNGFEIIKNLYLEHKPFDVETNGILTPTMKLKRFDAIRYYAKIIDQLYNENN